MSGYSIKGTEIYEDGPSRKVTVPTIEANGKTLDRICKCTERTTDVATLKRIDGQILNECYIDLTLDKLRELDNDKDAQERYISTRARFTDGHGMINVLVVKVTLAANQKITDTDYDYLNSLLCWPRNDIFLMPTVSYSHDAKERPYSECYNEFVAEMLKKRESYTDSTLGIMIPSYYPRGMLDNLFDNVYKNSNAGGFVALDFNNTTLDKPNGVVPYLGPLMKKEYDEKFFLYGVNVKPYRNKVDVSKAWDIGYASTMFNALGPVHTKPRAVVLPSDWRGMGRAYDSEGIDYPKMDNKKVRDSFIEWIGDDNGYRIKLSDEFSENPSNLYKYLKRYNLEKTNGTLSLMSQAVRKNDEDVIKGIIDKRPKEIDNLFASGGRRRRSYGK